MTCPSPAPQLRPISPIGMEVLVCPLCQGALIWEDQLRHHLFCRFCKVRYPLLDHIALLRPEDAQPIIEPAMNT